jgi:hypothetical protein
MYRTIALFVLTGLLVASARGADKERPPVPPPADVEKATKLVRELFKDEYGKTQPKARQALVEKLIKQAEETADDPVARYALYREAADLAAAAGEVTVSLGALDAIRARFSGVKSERDEPTLKTLATKGPTAGWWTTRSRPTNSTRPSGWRSWPRSPPAARRTPAPLPQQPVG